MSFWNYMSFIIHSERKDLLSFWDQSIALLEGIIIAKLNPKTILKNY